VFNQAQDTYFAIRKTEAVASSLNWHIGANDTAPVVPLDLGAWKVLTALQTGGESVVYTDPASPSTAKQGAIASGTAKLSLGNSFVGGESMGGFIAEIRAYASALSATDRAFIEGLLRVKYGL